MENRNYEEQARRLSEITSFSYSTALQILRSDGAAKEHALQFLESDARWQRDWEDFDRARKKLHQLTYA